MNFEGSSEEEEVLGTHSHQHQPRILIVDDEQSILKSLAAVLRFCRPDFHIGTASSAEEAITILEHTEVDLLITDFKLPQMDGLSLVQSTLVEHPETRSILMTAYGTDSVDYGAYQSGCISYLEKPFDAERLLKSIDETIEGIRMTHDMRADQLVHAVCVAAKEEFDIAVRVSEGGKNGLLVMRDKQITYADFGTLLGTSALVAMLSCRNPKIECRPDAPELQNADLPVEWEALQRASFKKSIAGQIAELRASGRKLQELKAEESGKYPSQEQEAMAQKEILTELIQFLRETRQDEEVGRQVKRKRLHFHQSLEHDMVARQVRLRNLINAGVEHYSARNYAEAKRCWSEALSLDPNCQQAKHNLAFIHRLETQTSGSYPAMQQ